ncbi:MAG TPA: hypothetical protein VM659_14935 [Dongiaceae bacterium]|nr:hypothetical protein [Dongiaceae bacterium]
MIVASIADVSLITYLAGSGSFMTQLPAHLIGELFLATAAFALCLDEIKVRVLRRLRID